MFVEKLTNEQVNEFIWEYWAKENDFWGDIPELPQSRRSAWAMVSCAFSRKKLQIPK